MSTTLAEEMQRVKDNTDLEAFCDQFLTRRAPHTYNCPLCGSGTKRNKSAAFTVNNNLWFCHSCKEGGSIFTLYGKLNSTDNAREQLEGVASWANITLDLEGPKVSKGASKSRKRTTATASASTYSARATQRATEAPQPPKVDHKGVEYVEAAHAALMASDRASAPWVYLLGRGISEQIVERWHMGYDSGRVVVPYLGKEEELTGYYTARAIADPYEGGDKYINPKGTKPLFFASIEDGVAMGADAIKLGSFAFDVVVVEGQLDAIACAEAGINAIALGGSGWTKAAEWLLSSGPWGAVVVMTDPDEAGEKAGGNLSKELASKGVFSAYLPLDEDTEGHDPGEYMGRPKALRALLDERIKEVYDRRSREQEKELKRLGIGYASEIAFSVAEGHNLIEPISTGMAGLDEALDGGLVGQRLYVLGGYTSMGKTTLAHQIADNLALASHHVLFVSIEQRASELVPKSLARMIADGVSGEPIYATPKQLTHRAERRRWEQTPGNKEALSYAAGVYDLEISPYMHYMDAQGQPTVRDIRTAAEVLKDKYGTAPIVFVDYLQLLTPPQENTRDEKDAIKQNMVALRQLAGEMDTPVFVLAALSRSGAEKALEADSFRDSSNIEYSSDVLLGLQPYNMRKRLASADEKKRAFTANKILAETKSEKYRELEVVVIKNRHGDTRNGEGEGVKVIFHGATGRFKEKGFEKGARPKSKRITL